MCDIETKIIKAIKEIPEDNYIKKWLTKNLIVNNDAIIECIAKCTSPVHIEKDDTPDKIKQKVQTIFKAFSLFEPKDTQILILGQDPYPANKYPNMADGLAFSQNRQQPPVESLLNIFKAIKVYKDDMNRYFCDINNDDVKWNTNLENWAQNKKILLLNTALTHEDKDDQIILKHRNAWEPFIKHIIANLIKSKIDNPDNNNKLAIFLWGEYAQNVFFQSLNELNKNGKYNTEIGKLQHKYIKFNQISKNKKINKIKKVIKKEKAIKIFNEKFELYLTSHPSQISENNDGKFIAYSPNHFKACDDFLCDNIWQNFPDNNKKQ